MQLVLSMGMKPRGRVGAPLAPRLRVVDWPSGRVRREVFHTPIPGDHARGDHREFTGATRCGDTLLQTTRTDVLWLAWPELTVLKRFSHPLMYDVHAACPLPDGGIAVAATGHESVLCFDAEGALTAHHWLRDGDFATAYAHTADFRTVACDRFKPHTHHPNHVAVIDGDLWVTELATRRARCLTADRPVLGFPEGPPHDGRRVGDEVWFTTVTGHLIAYDPHTWTRVRHLNLSQMSSSARMPGWYRGIDRVGSRLFVGMTTLRSSRQREFLRWVARGEAGRKQPTRVVEVDLDSGTIVREVPVGNDTGGTLYAIHALTEAHRRSQPRARDATPCEGVRVRSECLDR